MVGLDRVNQNIETFCEYISAVATKGLVTHYGEVGWRGYTTGGGVQVKFYPYKIKGLGGGGVLAMLKGGRNKFCGSFNTGT